MDGMEKGLKPSKVRSPSLHAGIRKGRPCPKEGNKLLALFPLLPSTGFGVRGLFGGGGKPQGLLAPVPSAGSDQHSRTARMLSEALPLNLKQRSPAHHLSAPNTYVLWDEPCIVCAQGELQLLRTASPYSKARRLQPPAPPGFLWCSFFFFFQTGLVLCADSLQAGLSPNVRQEAGLIPWISSAR